MGFLDDLLKGAAGGGSGIGKSLGLEPGHEALAGALVGMLAKGEQGGLAGLKQSLEGGGLGDVVGSWIGTGENRPIQGAQLESALGSGFVAQLAAQAGIDPGTASSALASVLPTVVDKLTPGGSLPSQASLLDLASGLLSGRK
jgi:uncharacterized protein YidB (DUF937 family)